VTLRSVASGAGWLEAVFDFTFPSHDRLDAARFCEHFARLVGA
jgi:hypothetical protein